MGFEISFSVYLSDFFLPVGVRGAFYSSERGFGEVLAMQVISPS